jgi:cell wall-associated NlpC family hydrolase
MDRLSTVRRNRFGSRRRLRIAAGTVLRARLLLLLALLLAGCATPRFTTPPPSGRPPSREQEPARPRPAPREREAPRAALPAPAVLEAATAYLGTPYRWGGSTRRGMDCSGLVWRAFHDAGGRQLPRTSAAMAREGLPLTRAELQPGDLVFFATGGGGIDHVGIYEGGGSFIHASSSRGVVRSSLSERYWRRSYAGARRIR